MNEIIYLEPDEDITTVIGRIKSMPAGAVSLVVPRGGVIAQSLINLKLLKREIEKLGKAVTLVTKDKISRNLASQVGMTVYSSASEARNARVLPQVAQASNIAGDNAEGSPDPAIKINRYSRENAEEGGEDGGEGEEDGEGRDDKEGKEDIDRREYGRGHTPEVAQDQTESEYSMNSNHNERDKMARRRLASRRKPILLLASVFVIIALISAVIILPQASVKITLATEDLNLNQEIKADKAATASSLETMVIPVKEYTNEKELEKQFNASGSKDIGSKAGGEITFYNDFDPSSAVSLADGTQLTASGKVFVLDGAISIPPATIISLYPLKTNPGQIKGKVVAKEVGDSYNIATAKFTVNAYSGVKQEKVYGQSSVALSGGSSNIVKIVSAADIEQAKASLDDELSAFIKEQIGKSADTDSIKLVVSSITKTAGDFSSSKKADDQADNFNAKYSIKISELGFAEQTLQELMVKKAENGIKGDQMLVNTSSNTINYEVANVDAAKGIISFKSALVGKIGTKMKESDIRNILVRAKYGTAADKIEAISGVTRADIKITPNFWPFLPWIKQRIKVSFDYQK